jgi:hypothetical protein
VVRRIADPGCTLQKDLLGAYSFKCDLTDKELGLLPGDILVQVRTVIHSSVQQHAVRQADALCLYPCIRVCVCVCVCARAQFIDGVNA